MGQSGLVNARDLAIKHGTYSPKVLTDPICQIRKAAKPISITRHQPAFAVIDVGQRPEAINLELKEKFFGIKRL